MSKYLTSYLSTRVRNAVVQRMPAVSTRKYCAPSTPAPAALIADASWAPVATAKGSCQRSKETAGGVAPQARHP